MKLDRDLQLKIDTWDRHLDNLLHQEQQDKPLHQDRQADKHQVILTDQPEVVIRH
jgi:hypothetical protein